MTNEVASQAPVPENLTNAFTELGVASVLDAFSNHRKTLEDCGSKIILKEFNIAAVLVWDLMHGNTKHTPCPNGYIQWHQWAKIKSKTHKQIKCDCCGLYEIWVKKRAKGC